MSVNHPDREKKKRGGMMRWILVCVLCFPHWLYGEGYSADSLKVTETVRQFVKQHDINGTDLEIVHKILKITHDPFLFIKIDRKLLKTWINDPSLLNEFKRNLADKKKHVDALNNLRHNRLLTGEEYKKRKELIQTVFFDEHNVRVYENLIKGKNMVSKDMAFVVSGSEAITHRVRDGCTTMAHLFIALAKAAGIDDVRFVVGANVTEYEKACPNMGKSRTKDVEIDGHMMALVKIEDRWALVNCTRYEPYSLDEDTRYEILYEFEGQAISPDILLGKVLRLPSFQREDFPPAELLIVGVGKNKNDDLDVENHNALMNLSVSGSPRSSICRWIIQERR
jgi:hypothetical protein